MDKKICVVTGSRSEYGLLQGVMKEIVKDDSLKLQIIASAMHLSPEFGLTYQSILRDGFEINEKIEMLLSSDTSVGITKSIGLGVIGFADAFARLAPDLIILLGDRFEALAAAQAAFIAKIPIAHIHGGELTLGAYDDGIRHSISKMSHLHFVATETYRQRVIQLGEPPERVHLTGALVLDSLKHLEFYTKDELEELLSIKFNKKNFVITYHPETLSFQSPQEAFFELLTALDSIEDTTFIFTKGNADTNGRIINELIEEYCQQHPHKAKCFVELGHQTYLSLLRVVDLAIGNSSSGIIEAPYFRKPTVNIGDRQKGRVKPPSVINCQAESNAIQAAIQQALSSEHQQLIAEMLLLYGDGKIAAKVISIIKSWNLADLIHKNFYDLPSCPLSKTS